jgi:hypothetical protein
VGVGDGTIRDCVVSNLVIKDSGGGIDVLSNYSANRRGVDIENIRFSNILIDAIFPFSVSTGYKGRSVRDIAFSSVTFKAGTAGFIGGADDNRVSNVTFRDVDLVVSGGELNHPDTPTPMESWKSNRHGIYHATGRGLPCVLYAENASGVRFEGLRVRRTDQAGVWENVFRLKKCDDFEFCRTTVEGFDHLPPDAVVRAEQSGRITFDRELS